MNKNLLQDLICPITLEVLVDPISVPCCGKAFSRSALKNHFEYRRSCPSCNAALESLDVDNMAKNVVLAGMIETLREEKTIQKVNHKWSCDITPLKEGSQMTELTLKLNNSNFKLKPSLFIAVLDRSGSMNGNPFLQVKTALQHIEALADQNNQVKLVLLSYGSDCRQIHSSEEYFIQGGTNFRSAFIFIKNILDSYNLESISSVSIAFLTDGQDLESNKESLVPTFRDIIQSYENIAITVHTIGFSDDCDRNLLEGMRTAGTIEGIFRYAEPTDDDDALCQKLTSIFNISSKSSTAEVQLTINNCTQTIRLPINAQNYGEYKQWIEYKENYSILVSSQLDEEVKVPIILKSPSNTVWNKWLSYQTDILASEIVKLSKQTSTENIKELNYSIQRKKIDVIKAHFQDERLDYMQEQLEQYRKGKTVNLGKLTDMSFASTFFGMSKKQSSIMSVPQLSPRKECKKEPLDYFAYYEYPLKRYSRNNTDKERNSLQEMICNHNTNTLSKTIKERIDRASITEITYKDCDGNNTLMLACYCGFSKIVSYILDKFAINLETINNDGETALTLAIKKRGFHYTVGHLLDKGAKIPRLKSLERYAIENGFKITAEILSNQSKLEEKIKINETMTSEYILYCYNREKNKKDFDRQLYLQVCLAKQMTEIAKELISVYSAQPTIDMLLDHCIPKKADDPETEKYLELAKLLLDDKPSLVTQKKEPEMESPLFSSANKGSLPHVKYFLSMGAVIDDPNEKGNTPLWIASYKRYPCIMKELLDNGADVNWKNYKGNPPLYGVCERGPVKIAELLVSYGAEVEWENRNGDTSILLCCRNGQYEVLQFLLNYVDTRFVNKKAQIDGFNALMAATEQNKSDCIRVLQEFGIDLDQKTEVTNEILPEAASLHIASYYNRAEATKMLLQLGANPNITDVNGNTPLHIAVIQNHVEIIKILKYRGANLMLKNKSGNTPLMYCRDNKIRNILVDSTLDILMKLVKGGFTLEEEKVAIDILAAVKSIPDVLTTKELIDVYDFDNSTPLLQSVIYGNRKMVEVLVNLGASKENKNIYGKDSVFWAQWLKNKRMLEIMGVLSSNIPSDIFEYSGVKKQLLFLKNKPKYTFNMKSGIIDRMNYFINITNPKKNKKRLAWIKFRKENKNSDKTNHILSIESDTLDCSLWHAKVFTINKIESKEQLETEEILALSLYTNNNELFKKVNNSIIYNTENFRLYTKLLYFSLTKLPLFIGEVYIGSGNVNRKLYLKDTVFTWGHFMSGSTVWKVALTFDKGTVFIVKSQTGRYVGNYSQYCIDNEVIFLPNTQFKVTNWYHGDVIALGQPNIRDTSYQVKEKDDRQVELDKMINSDKSLIIEITEI